MDSIDRRMLVNNFFPVDYGGCYKPLYNDNASERPHATVAGECSCFNLEL